MSIFNRYEDHSDESFIKSVADSQRNHHPFNGNPLPLRTSQSAEPEPRQGLGTFTVSEIMQGMGATTPEGLTWDAFNQTMSGDLGHFIDSEGGAQGILRGRAELVAQDILEGRRGFDDGVFTQESGLPMRSINEGVAGVTSGPTSTNISEGPGAISGTYVPVGSKEFGPGTKIYNPPPGKSWAKGQLSFEQVADLCLSVGLDRNMAVLFTAIARRESSHNSFAYNGNAATGDDSYGLWQINVIAGAMLPQYLEMWRGFDLIDPFTNASAMKWLLDQGGSSQQNWYTNSDGSGTHDGYSVVQYMDEARRAVDAVLRR